MGARTGVGVLRTFLPSAKGGKEGEFRASSPPRQPALRQTPLQLSFFEIRQAVRRMTEPEVLRALRERIFPIAWAPGAIFFAAGGQAAAKRAEARGIKIEAVADPADVLDALQREMDGELRARAVWGLDDDAPELSAAIRGTLSQGLTLLILLASIVALSIRFPAAAPTVLSVTCAVFFLLVIGLKLMSLWRLPAAPAPDPLPLKRSELPAYTVLVPLFREAEMVKQLLSALLRIDYPRDRLDIKLILEAADLETRRAVSAAALPEHIEAIVVPACRPQTKPKALNYALPFARGEYVTVFDAEDEPDPGELRLAAENFADAPRDLACLQAPLRFYNAEENWLTNGIMAQTPQVAP
jgi:hypothetical protein